MFLLWLLALKGHCLSCWQHTLGARSQAGGALSVGLCQCSPAAASAGAQGSPAAGLSLEPGWLHRVALPVPAAEQPWPGAVCSGLEARTQPCPASWQKWVAATGHRKGESIRRVCSGWLTRGLPSLSRTRGSSHTAILFPFPVAWDISGAPLWLRAGLQSAPPRRQHAADAGMGLIPSV